VVVEAAVAVEAVVGDAVVVEAVAADAGVRTRVALTMANSPTSAIAGAIRLLTPDRYL
jgi:hypothetical protein